MRVCGAAALLAPQANDAIVLLSVAEAISIANARRLLAVAAMVSNGEGRGHLEFVASVGVVDGRHVDLVRRIEHVSAGLVFLVAEDDRAGGDGGLGGVAGSECRAVAAVVLAAIAKAVAATVDTLAGGFEGVECGCGLREEETGAPLNGDAELCRILAQ